MLLQMALLEGSIHTYSSGNTQEQTKKTKLIIIKNENQNKITKEHKLKEKI